MSNLVLETDKSNLIGGIVLTSQGAGWKRPTGVFLPDPTIAADLNLTILLWFHGHYIKDLSALFYKEETRILKAVLDSKKRIVVVAPHLGWFKSKKDTDYNASALADGGSTIERYLDEVLAALADWNVSQVANTGLRTAPKYGVAELYIAGHSGGGGGIMSSVATLGRYTDAHRECWGFDCLYGAGQKWYEWAKARAGMPLYFYFGQGTQPAYGGDVLGLWKPAYGTPKYPLALGARMLNLHLAPALPGAELDMVAFQNSEDIKARPQAGNRYEEVRKKVDPLLDEPARYWSTLIAQGLKDHYPVVSDLLGPRIRQSLP